MTLDKTVHYFLRLLIEDAIVWRRTCVPWIKSYYAEHGVYLLRDMRYTTPSFAIVAAKSPDEAAKWQRKHGGWRLTAKQQRARERYQDWLRPDGGESFHEYLARRRDAK